VYLLAAPDKFRGTLTAGEVAATVARAAEASGWDCGCIPVADGGEGTLEALGGPNRTTTVTGPLGDLVVAPWRRAGDLAVLEMALASGLDLVGGPEGNDPVAAATHGTGELISAALDAGCRRVILGSRARSAPRPPSVDAAPVFAPQKGASPAQVELLRRRLERLAQLYRQTHGVDVLTLAGSGAAGGLAGGLAAVGARLVPGFDLVADELDLDGRLQGADLVVTGEGFLDDQSFAGKAVGGVVELAQAAGVAVLVIAGEVLDDVTVPAGVAVISLVERFGRRRAMEEAAACMTEAVTSHLLTTF
jgi:glycerate kinase